MKTKTKFIGVSAASVILSVLGGAEIALAEGSSYAAKGIHSGSFFIYPVVEIGIGYDDNVFRLPDDNAAATGSEFLEPQSDTVITGRASVTANSDWNRHALNGIASVNLGKYSDFDSEDFGNYALGGDGRLDIKRGSFATGRLGVRQQNEDRNSVDSREVASASDVPLVYGAEPTEYTDTYIGAGFSYKPARLAVNGDLDYNTLDYEDNINVFGDGLINNSDRDRSRSVARLRVGYDVRPQKSLYVQGEVNGVDYDEQFDQNGIERSSTGSKVTVGMNFDLSNLLLGDIFVGHLEQNYDSDTQEDISSDVYGAGLTWFPSRLTSVTLDVDRNVEESTEATASGYLSTTAIIGINHELKRNIILSANADYTRNEFQQNVEGQKEEESITGFGLEGRYVISSLFYTRLQLRHESRDSDIKLQEYTSNRAMLSFGANW